MFRVIPVLAVVFFIIASDGSSAGALPRQDIDYPGLYAKGITFAEFLENARARRDQWRAHYNDATVTPDLITRMRALSETRRLLIVTEDWCSDSANTVPYIARLVDGAPERLEMRVVDSQLGKAVMEAHRTPDGRTATPTVVVLGADGRVIGAWTERPSSTQTWFLEKQNTTMQKPLHDELIDWYAKDAGKTTVSEIAEILSR
jgi:Thioredoxin